LTCPCVARDTHARIGRAIVLIALNVKFMEE
jgi:hypothetical protein